MMLASKLRNNSIPILETLRLHHNLLITITLIEPNQILSFPASFHDGILPSLNQNRPQA